MIKRDAGFFTGGYKAADTHKKCTCCCTIKTIDNFTKETTRKSRPGARKSVCKSCKALKDHERYANKRKEAKKTSLDIFDFWK